MTITIEELRRKYPNPVSHPERDLSGKSYCVGMACLAEMKEQGGFAAYWHENINLPAHEARAIWHHIIRENDAGNFDVAWAWLDKGLTA